MEKLRRFLKLEANNDEFCLWLSFCDPNLPKGEQFLGVIVTKCKGLATAIEKINKLGINPGGEIFAIETNGEEMLEEHFDRLLSKDDISVYADVVKHEDFLTRFVH